MENPTSQRFPPSLPLSLSLVISHISARKCKKHVLEVKLAQKMGITEKRVLTA